MERSMNKIVLVTQKTRLQELLYKYNTREQAKFHIEHMGADFSDYILEDDIYQKALSDAKRISEKYARISVIDREYLPHMLFGNDDIVVALGRDGLVCNIMKYLQGQRLIGINPDPARWDGVLLPYETAQLEDILPKVINENCEIKMVSMAKAVTNDGQKMLAVNDFFIGPKSHTSARYELTTLNREGRPVTEQQSSSGIIISTGIGQSGWYKSVMTQARAALGIFGYESDQEYKSIGWDENRLSFVVREPFPSNTTEATLVFGTLSRGIPFRVLSQMSENGVIFSDGMESDAISFNAGVVVSIGISEKKGCLVR